MRQLERDRLVARRVEPGCVVACRLDAGKPLTEADNCMVRVEGGPFLMGAQSTEPAAPGYDPDAAPDEAPPHRVTLSPFFIHLTEVTAGQYQACANAGACPASEVLSPGGDFNYNVFGRHLHPMNGISWQGAAAFCRAIGGRLPTEAEWERAARAGDARKYPWGDEPADCLHAVMHEGAQPSGCGLDHTQEAWVPPKQGGHPLGLRHMAGNVWEWTADWYDETYYRQSPDRDPRGPNDGTRRVQRGGGFAGADPVELRAAFRAALPPDVRQSDLGFRCAADDGAISKQ